MNRFYITGLPRSRTAWFSALFSCGDVFCSHEGVSRYRSPKEYISATEYMPYDYIGDSNTLLVLKYNELVKSQDKVVVVLRDINDSVESSMKWLDKQGISDKSLHKVLLEKYTEYDKTIRSIYALQVRFEDIDDRIEEIWDYCIGEYYDPVRVEEYKKLNIQTTITMSDYIQSPMTNSGGVKCLGL
jgi:hypothetical protein